MAKKKSTGAGQIIPERIMDWSGGQNNAVNVALLNDNESRLLQNYSLDEKGTLFPFPGSLKRYAADLGASPVSGMGKLYKSDGTSKFLIGLEDGKLYVDTPHLINLYDTQAEFNGGGNFAVQADVGGKLWPMIIKDGFESGLFDDWHTHDSGWTIDSTVYKTGAKSAKGTGTTQKLIREFGFNAGQLYVKMAVRFAEANQLHYPVILISPTGTEIQAVVSGTDGHFKYHNGSALANFPTDKTYAANTWYVVEVWVRGGTFLVSIDGVNLTASTLTLKDVANAAQTQASKLQIQNAGGTSATTYIDDVEINLLAPVFSRDSVAYKQDGTQAAAGVPRYEAVDGRQGLKIEELTTNVVLDPSFENADITANWNAASYYEWVYTVGTARVRDTTYKKYGTASAKCGDGVNGAKGIAEKNQGTAAHAVAAAQNWELSFDAYGTDAARYIACIRCYDAVGNNVSGTVTSPSGWLYSASYAALYFTGTPSATAVWQRITKLFTVPTGVTFAAISLQYYADGTIKYIWFDGVQFENKDHATSFIEGTRAAEVLAIPTVGVISGEKGTIEFKMYVPALSSDQCQVFDCSSGDNNNRIAVYGTMTSLRAFVGNGSIYIQTGYLNLQVGMNYIGLSWGPSGVIFRVNGQSITNVSINRGPTTLATNMYLGSSIYTSLQALDALYNDLRCSSIDKTDAEMAAAYNGGLPLTVDGDTALLMPCNGNLNILTTHHWISPAIDCSNATDQSSGHAALTTITPGASNVTVYSRSAPASTGPWTAWVAALGDGSLQHTANDYVQVKLILARDGENDPYVDSLTVSFDGQATATLLASDFSPGKQFFFDQLNDLLAVMTGDAPRKYDGTTLAAMGGSPPHAPYGVAHKNRFWMAKGSRLYFSDLLNVESWPVLNFIDIMPNDGDEITGMITFGDYLIIAKGHSVWMLIGETINTFRVRRIHSDRGCYAPRSLCIVNQMLCFVSDDGIYFSDFTQPVLISERIRKTWDGLNKRRLNLIASWFFDHKLYVAVPDAGQQRNNRVLVYDSLRQAFAGDRIWPVSCWTDFREAGEINSFFGRSDLGNVRKINTGYNDDGAVFEAIYESKAISHGAPEILKRYNVGYLQVKPAALDAELIISFIVDGVETPTMTVPVPANATGLIETLQIFASEVGVVSGHRIQVKIRQQVLDNPLGIQSVYLEALPLLIAPTLRG